MPLTNKFKQTLNAFLNNQLDSESILIFLKELEEVDQAALIAVLTEMGVDDNAWKNISALHQPLWDKKFAQLWEGLALQAKEEENIVLQMAPKSSRRLWYWAAAVLLSTAFVGYLYLKSSYKEELPILSPSEIYASKNVSQITLPDGRVLLIQDSLQGLVYQDDQLHILRTATGELKFEHTGQALSAHSKPMNTIQTSKGGFSVFQLEDGTKVHLNSESSLRFPLAFGKDRREVHLVGEGYFEVVKNKQSPFIVHTENQHLEVLGTVFNMRSYPNESNEETTLITGSVKIHNERLNLGEEVLLKPGQQARVNEKDIQVQQVNPAEYTAWIQQRFVFSGTALSVVLLDIERWYDVGFEYEGTIPSIHIDGNISKDVPLEHLLKVLELNTHYKFSMKGRRVVMSK